MFFMSLFMDLSASADELIPVKSLRFIRKSAAANGLFYVSLTKSLDSANHF
ncbi:hypothetical protein Brsp02_00906 [Brucella sp. NBRC 113783]